MAAVRYAVIVDAQRVGETYPSYGDAKFVAEGIKKEFPHCAVAIESTTGKYTVI